MPRDLDRSALPCPLHPTPKSRARKTSPAASEQSAGPGKSGLWGAGNGPWWLEEMWLGAFTRAPPARDARAFRARGRPSFPQSITQALGGLVTFGPSGTEPALSRPRRGKTPPGAAGTCQASVRGDAASARGPGRPSKPCGSDAAGCTPIQKATGSGHSRETPLRPSTPMEQAPALAGERLRKLPARRYGPRKPELTASRRPKLRGPRPSVQDGRHDKCGTGREGVEKIARIFRAIPWGRLETMGEQSMSLRQA
jgi:hypothetical protein